MLIEFSVANFRSIKEKATLSLDASSDDWLQETNVFSVGQQRLLKSAAIYGPNAGGKTNLLAAMSTFRELLLNSSKESQVGEEIPVSPFKLQTTTTSAPTFFEAIFLIGLTRYRYGFEATHSGVRSEWLFSQADSTRETRLFTREQEKIDCSLEFKEGKGLEPRTRVNALFLSVVGQFNGKIAGEITQWMSRFRSISGLEDVHYLRFTATLLKDPHYGNLIRNLTRRADVGIDNLQTIEIPPDELRKLLPKNVPDGIREALLNARSGEAFAVKTQHKVYDDQERPSGTVDFDLKLEESAGTQKFISMSGPFLHTLEQGSILFVDELEARLHPLLTRALVGLFNGPANRQNAQLIYVTHDEGLLDPARIRRDQVWFVEKDHVGASHLFSLAEFKVRKESKFAKEYLLGQFGAVPHVRELEEALTRGDVE
jgi:AAA15 family ATPase/GTPase